MKTTKLFTCLLALATLATCSAVAAQDPRDLMPDVSSAKAKGILNDAIAAMGGLAYLNAQDLDCSGNYSGFDSSGAAEGIFEVRTLRQYPDKNRIEIDTRLPVLIAEMYGIPLNKKGRHIVNVYSGDKAWSLNGDEEVEDMGPEAPAQFQDQLKGDINMILRYHMNDPSMSFRYAGTDIVDIKQVDWVEITDSERRVIRVAIDKKTHFPVRTSVTTRNPTTGERTESSRVYTNFRPFQGIQTPMQISNFLNGRQASQTFYKTCTFDSGVSPDLFTEAGLQAQSKKGGKKSK